MCRSDATERNLQSGTAIALTLFGAPGSADLGASESAQVMRPTALASMQTLAMNAIDIVHQDEQLLVLNKPCGLLSVPGRGPDKQDCLSSRVQAQFPQARVVHRLDMDTSGLMIMALDSQTQRTLSQAFAQREISKRYEAVVLGTPTAPQTDDQGWALIDLPILLDWPKRPMRIINSAGKPSQTRWRLMKSMGIHSLVQLEPLTGRSHQLRVHLQAIGHTIVGDRLYGSPTTSTSRLMLHAGELKFTHPRDGHVLHLRCPSGFATMHH